MLMMADMHGKAAHLTCLVLFDAPAEGLSKTSAALQLVFAECPADQAELSSRVAGQI